ncbi:hypothetical protein [Ancylobacter polymorphus]|uniref:Uncharacterized protein n=1 Tax=Ancylobacter polymorphus TaxID=223390 RepID=A0A9E7D745_9HYPH|nr:hypothetical protein [Ancylobacter polymorphus]UOK73025.1 hypothetical protein K9D25_10150 [Ancylobacter polymorphus]
METVHAALCFGVPLVVMTCGPAVQRGLILARQSELWPFDMLAGLLLIAALGSLAF